jgi:hypothetical protein
MRRLAILTVGLAALALSQGVFKFSDATGNLTLQAKSATATQASNQTYRFSLSHGVVAESKSQGLQFQSDSLKAIAIPKNGSTGKSVIRSAEAGGGVVVVKTVATGKTILRGSSAQYRSGSTEDGIDLAGPVSITNENTAKRQTLSAAGSRGHVSLVPGLTGKNPVRIATLRGSVTATIAQAPVKGHGPSTVKASGEQMVLNNLSQPRTVTLTGSVKITGTGDNSFTLQNVSKAVLRLNESGEVTGFEVAH